MGQGSTPPEARRVLIVDDHEDVRDAMCVLLESWGHTVRGAANGKEALALALAWQPDIVCLDLGLPVMSGFEVAKRIVAAFGEKHPVLIALSGFSREIDRQRAREAGFDGFITKPDEIDLLHDVLAYGPPLPSQAALLGSGQRSARDRTA